VKKVLGFILGAALLAVVMIIIINRLCLWYDFKRCSGQEKW